MPLRFSALILLGLLSIAYSAEYHVAAVGGSGANPGSQALPFLTIQRAATVMVAGDTCFIHAGTYRETVTPAHDGTAGSPITFRPYGSELVTLSGADPVAGWSAVSAGIYRADFNGALGDQDQVFVDGVMMNLARWPNSSLDQSRPAKARADSGSADLSANGDGSYGGLRSASYQCSALAQAAGFFAGARIHLIPGDEWLAQTGMVTASAPGSVTFTCNQVQENATATTYIPGAGDPFFLFGTLALLDAPGEWFIDAAANRLYLWPPQNDAPDGHRIEAKRRDQAFELAGRSYITIQGLHLFACALNTSSSTQHVVLDGLDCRYVSHFSRIDTAGMWGLHTEDSGLIIKGSNHVLRNSHIAFSAGNGVTLMGSGHLVDNCLIHDVDYAALDCAAINTGNASAVDTSDSHEIAHNTLYNSGRGLLLLRAMTRGDVHHNAIYRSMLQTTDGGGIYSYNHDGKGTAIHHNRVSDHVCGGDGDPGNGIYLDNNSGNFLVHHNLVYNTWTALHYNLASTGMRWFNNTAIGFGNSYTGGYTGSAAGTEVRNNVFTALVQPAADMILSNNLASPTDPAFSDPQGLDFSLQATSPAVDAGLALPPLTDGFAGAAPDAGAFEYGQVAWAAGSDLSARPPPGPVHLAASVTDSSVALSWSDRSTNESAFVVERSLDNKRYAVHAVLPAGSITYTDRAVRRGVTYHYRVRADESANSNYIAAKPLGHDATAIIQAEELDEQVGLVVSGGLGSCDAGDWARYTAVDFAGGATSVTMRLASGATSTTHYIELRLDSPTGTRIANINVLGTGGYDVYVLLTAAMTPVSGVHDLYLVFTGGSGVANLDYLSFNVPAPPAAGPPNSLTAVGLSSSTIQVAWLDPGGSATGVIVERSSDRQNFVEIGSLATPAINVTDSGLAAGSTWLYRARTCSSMGFSDYSETAAATTPADGAKNSVGADSGGQGCGVGLGLVLAGLLLVRFRPRR